MDNETISGLFAGLRSPIQCGDHKVIVDDSKAVFKASQGLGMLHAVVSAAIHWSGEEQNRLLDWLQIISRQDSGLLSQLAWFEDLGEQPFLSNDDTSSVLQHWQSTGIQLAAVQSRIIAARQFNGYCNDGFNKADLLSESTIGLVRELWESGSDAPASTIVFCDRHGGRRYYGGVLQHSFPDAQLQVVSESKHQSRYRMTTDDTTIDFAFTVKGDSFTPVAMSSMIAKYLRERLMKSLNDYFAKRHRGSETLNPTAGYPVDADRFIQQIEPIITAENITRSDLIRSR